MPRFLCYYRSFDATGVASLHLDTYSLKEAKALAEIRLAELDLELESIKFVHGGSRPGSGLKPKYFLPTKPKKVPPPLDKQLDEFLESCQALVETIDFYSQLADNAPTSPRFDKLKSFLSDSSNAFVYVKATLHEIYNGPFIV